MARRRRLSGILPPTRRRFLIAQREGAFGGRPKQTAAYLLVGRNAGNTEGLIYWSNDGLSWTKATGVPAAFRPVACAGSGSTWIAVGTDGGTNVTILYSATGKTWSSVSGPNPGGTGNFNYAGYNATLGLFIATASNQGAPYIMGTSPDGVTWATVSVAAPASNAGGPIGVNGAHTVFCSPGGFDTYYSDDASSWTRSVTKLAAGTTLQTSLPFSGSVFVIGDATNASPIMQRTATGAAWAFTTVAGAHGTARSVAWNGTNFCALGTAIYTSDAAGAAWTFKGAGPATAYIGLIWDPKNSYFLGIATNAYVAVAADGSSYVEGALPTGVWSSVQYVNPTA
jgi:hypothetical protein